MGRSEAKRMGSAAHGRLGLRPASRIFIIEGPDGAGKTWLANQIGGHYLHAVHRFKGRMVLYHLALLKKAVELSQTGHVVIDRWRLSEIVYGNVFRDGPEHPELTDQMFSLAKSAGAVFINCVPSNREQYLSAFETLRNEREEKYNTMAEVYDEYKLRESVVPALNHDRFKRGIDMGFVNYTIDCFDRSNYEPITCKRKIP